MKPVYQNKFFDLEKNTRGNCLQAATASILDLSLDEVPNFHDAPEELGFWGFFYTFLKRHGFVVWEVDGVTGPRLDCFYLAHGNSPRWVMHTCIFRRGQCVHDPHPSGLGLVGIPDRITVLVPVDPASFTHNAG